jgi:hypothetical protein
MNPEITDQTSELDAAENARRAQRAEAALTEIKALLCDWEDAHTHLGLERVHYGPSSSSLRAILNGYEG